MAEQASTVAAIGLGRMGPGTAQSILKAGYPLIVYSRSRAKTEQLVAADASAADSARVAAAGKLAALLAGEPDIVARCRPLLETFTNMIVGVGEHPAAAARMKPTINFFLSGLLESMAEAYVFVEKLGLDTATVQALMINQVLPNPAVREYAERIRTHYYDDAGATLGTGLKDLGMILSEAANVHAPLPIADLVRNNILVGLARGQDSLDWCVPTEANRIAAGLA